jgi:hypothetical protein
MLQKPVFIAFFFIVHRHVPIAKCLLLTYCVVCGNDNPSRAVICIGLTHVRKPLDGQQYWCNVNIPNPASGCRQQLESNSCTALVYQFYQDEMNLLELVKLCQKLSICLIIVISCCNLTRIQFDDLSPRPSALTTHQLLKQRDHFRAFAIEIRGDRKKEITCLA